VLFFASEGLLGMRKLWPDPLRAFFLVVAVIFRGIPSSSRTVSRTTRLSAPCHISLPLSALSWRFPVAALRSASGIGSAPHGAVRWRLGVAAFGSARGIGSEPYGAVRWRLGVAAFGSARGIGSEPYGAVRCCLRPAPCPVVLRTG